VRGRIVSIDGRVIEVRDHHDGVEVVLEIWTADDSGKRLAPGTCTVVIDR
jgi:hypothetical protein